MSGPGRWTLGAWLLIGALALVACDGCERGGTVPLRPDLAFVPGRLDLGTRSIGARVERTVAIENRSRASHAVEWVLSEGPVQAPDLPAVLPPGSTFLKLIHAPTVVGVIGQRLEVRVGGAALAQLTIEGLATAVPDCAPPPTCRTVTYDVQSESCVQVQAPDGSACGTDNLCLVGGACRQGTCLGSAVDCDDGNACTLDVCRPLIGCEALPVPPCPADGPCTRGVCDPAVGCTVAPVDDGTLCVGGRTDCDVVDVCFRGACEPRPTPQGFTCAEASPCQGEGHCEGTACVRPPPTTLAVDWTLDGRGLGQPRPTHRFHDLWMDADGAVSLEGWPSERPLLRASEAGAVGGFSGSRRCLGWDGRPVCSDFPFTAAVSLIHPASGDPQWTFWVDEATPGLEGWFSTIPGLTFVTRLATLSTDRLLAIYESYHPDALDNADDRRRYAAVVLDAQGRLVRVTRLEDPLLERTDHPHPFGVAADALGNLYLCFSPSRSVPGASGVVAGRPSLFLSLSRDGQERWRAHHDFEGGELAVAEGILYPERANQAFSALDGHALVALPGGKLVVGGGHAVTFSAPGSPLLLEGRTSPSLLPSWTHAIGPEHVLDSPLLALSRWQPRAGVDRTVVLAQLAAVGPVAHPARLLGVDAQTGKEAFVCPLEAPPGGPLGTAQRLHAAGGFVTLMDGATPTGDDPPFASSPARFTRYRLPTLATPVAPWSGEFGGYDHDHQEEPALLLP